MTTLYELLGALPQDDKEDLKKKFHAAVKATHPDVHPDDPGASIRFRQIVRAHAVLSDTELRAAYDDMLAHQGGAPRGSLLSATMAKLVPDTIAISVLVAIMLGGYALFVHVSKTSVAANGSTAARGPAVVAAITMPSSAPVAQPEPRDAPARTELDHERIAPIAESPVVNAPSGEAIAAFGAPAEPARPDAGFYREEGRRAYLAGDFDLAIADFDLAIDLDPDVEAAYIDRSIVFYRIGEVERAFADLEKAKRIADANRAGTPQRKSLTSSR